MEEKNEDFSGIKKVNSPCLQSTMSFTATLAMVVKDEDPSAVNNNSKKQER